MYTPKEGENMWEIEVSSMIQIGENENPVVKDNAGLHVESGNTSDG